jgi:hypothetical protein
MRRGVKRWPTPPHPRTKRASRARRRVLRPKRRPPESRSSPGGPPTTTESIRSATRRDVIAASPGTSNASQQGSASEVPGTSSADHEASPRAVMNCRGATRANAARGGRESRLAPVRQSAGSRSPAADGGTSPQTRSRSGNTDAWCPPRVPLLRSLCAAKEAPHMGTTPYPVGGYGAEASGAFLGHRQLRIRVLKPPGGGLADDHGAPSR